MHGSINDLMVLKDKVRHLRIRYFTIFVMTSYMLLPGEAGKNFFVLLLLLLFIYYFIIFSFKNIFKIFFIKKKYVL